MDHDGARRLMAEGVEGRLGSGDERELALHLVGCPDCKSLYEGLQHAHPALAKIGIGPPPTKVVDAAVRRATTVLRGDADPGPLTTSVPAPAAPPVWSRDTGPLLAEDAVEPAATRDEPIADRPAAVPPRAVVVPPPSVAPPPPPPAPPMKVDPVVTRTEPLVEASIAEPNPPPTPPRPAVVPQTRHEPAAPPRPAPPDIPIERAPESPALPPLPEAPPPSEPPPSQPTAPYMPSIRSTEPPGRQPRPSPVPAVEHPTEVVPPPTTRISTDPVAHRIPRADEVEALLDEDYGADPVVVVPRGPRERRSVGAGPWLAAIAVTVALAILAAALLTRGQGLLGGDDLPTAAQVQTRLAQVFENMKSIKASFSVRKLSMYRTGGQQGSLVYTFANGEHTGRLVFDRAEGYRQEVTLSVNGREVDRAKIVQTSGETKVVGTNNDLVVERRPPLGPPDGKLRPSLGLLEESVGAAVEVLLKSEDLDVVGKTKRDDRELYEVKTSVTPNELTRADQLDVFIDARTFFPTIVRRSIGRTDAGVLGPGDVLTSDAISRAFGERERITTELVELDNVVLDDIILPGDFVLDAAGAQAQTRDSGFERVTRTQVGGKVSFQPLFPRFIPEGYKEQLLAVSADKRGWGPGGRYPAPDGIVHASYFDGKTTIVITERNMPGGPFAIDGSPLQQGTALPITVRPYERAEKRFFYGVSPEVPPHAFGFLGKVFAMVVGYAPAEDLIGILASLGEAPPSAPAVDVSPSPGATSSPLASTSPTGAAGMLPGEEP